MFYIKLRIWSFHIVVVHRMAKKCTKKYNARAGSLFCLLVFSDVLVSCRRHVCLSSLILSLVWDTKKTGVPSGNQTHDLRPWPNGVASYCKNLQHCLAMTFVCLRWAVFNLIKLKFVSKWMQVFHHLATQCKSMQAGLRHVYYRHMCKLHSNGFFATCILIASTCEFVWLPIASLSMHAQFPNLQCLAALLGQSFYMQSSHSNNWASSTGSLFVSWFTVHSIVHGTHKLMWHLSRLLNSWSLLRGSPAKRLAFQTLIFGHALWCIF